jgi:hypothetical protein
MNLPAPNSDCDLEAGTGHDCVNVRLFGAFANVLRL